LVDIKAEIAAIGAEESWTVRHISDRQAAMEARQAYP
jgi:hypothetical protein